MTSRIPDFSFYHRSEEIFALLDEWQGNYPEFIKILECPEKENRKPGENRPPKIPIVKIHQTINDFPSSIASDSSSSSLSSSSPSDFPGVSRFRVLLNFGEHGRELISSEVAVKFLEILLKEKTQKTPFYQYILRNSEILLIPLLNLWSRQQVEKGHYCVRKNENSVDLNRNYQWNFQNQQENYPQGENPGRAAVEANEQYPGEFPFSEYETRCLRDVGKSARPAIFVNVHSGIKEVYYGNDHVETAIPSEKESARLLSFLNHHACQCPQGPAGKIGGYPVFGGSMDYFYYVLNTTYSYTLEVFGGSSGPIFECFPFFNPLELAAYEETVEKWSQSLFLLIFGIIQEKYQIPYVFPLPEWWKLAGKEDFPQFPAFHQSLQVPTGISSLSLGDSVVYYHRPGKSLNSPRIVLFSGYHSSLDPFSHEFLLKFLDFPSEGEFLIFPALFPEEFYFLCPEREREEDFPLDSPPFPGRASYLAEFTRIVDEFSPDGLIEIKSGTFHQDFLVDRENPGQSKKIIRKNRNSWNQWGKLQGKKDYTRIYSNEIAQEMMKKSPGQGDSGEIPQEIRLSTEEWENFIFPPIGENLPQFLFEYYGPEYSPWTFLSSPQPNEDDRFPEDFYRPKGKSCRPDIPTRNYKGITEEFQRFLTKVVEIPVSTEGKSRSFSGVRQVRRNSALLMENSWFIIMAIGFFLVLLGRRFLQHRKKLRSN